MRSSRPRANRLAHELIRQGVYCAGKSAGPVYGSSTSGAVNSEDAADYPDFWPLNGLRVSGWCNFIWVGQASGRLNPAKWQSVLGGGEDGERKPPTHVELAPVDVAFVIRANTEREMLIPDQDDADNVPDDRGMPVVFRYVLR